MTSIELIILNKLGLHARAAAKFIAIANQFQCNITLKKLDTDGTNDPQEVNGKSIMALLILAAHQGTRLLLSTDGEDENEAAQAIKELVEHYFDEDE